MSFTSLIGIASAFLKLANFIFGYVRDRGLEKVGEDREKLRAFYELNAVSQRLKEINEQYDRMTPEQIRADIEAKGDFRD